MRNNDPDKLKELLEKGFVAFNRSIDGATPLHRAAEIGATRCAEILLDFHADVDAKDNRGFTAFHVAALNSHKQLGSFLMERRASLNCLSLKGRALKCQKCRAFVSRVNRWRQEAR